MYISNQYSFVDIISDQPAAFYEKAGKAIMVLLIAPILCKFEPVEQ